MKAYPIQAQRQAEYASSVIDFKEDTRTAINAVLDALASLRHLWHAWRAVRGGNHNENI